MDNALRVLLYSVLLTEKIPNSEKNKYSTLTTKKIKFIDNILKLITSSNSKK